MALIKCTECGYELSEYADKCPRCGCPTNIILENIKKNQEKEVVKQNVVSDNTVQETSPIVQPEKHVRHPYELLYLMTKKRELESDCIKYLVPKENAKLKVQTGKGCPLSDNAKTLDEKIEEFNEKMTKLLDTLPAEKEIKTPVKSVDTATKHCDSQMKSGKEGINDGTNCLIKIALIIGIIIYVLINIKECGKPYEDYGPRHTDTRVGY